MLHRKHFENVQVNPYLEALGWYGTVAILGAYAWANFSSHATQTLLYLLLNLTGALGLLIDSWYRKVYQPVVINGFWIIVAIIGILRLVH